MKFIALDLELNQPSNRIIQIGAVAFDTDRGMMNTFNAYIDPKEPVGWDFMLNIGITLEDLLARDFRDKWELYKQPPEQALKEFWEWQKSSGAGKKIIQWGSGDLSILIEESQGLGYPSHLRGFDLKRAYQFLWQPAARLEAQSGLGRACQNLGVPEPHPAHDALADAKATGYVMLKMFRQISALNKLLESV